MTQAAAATATQEAASGIKTTDGLLSALQHLEKLHPATSTLDASKASITMASLEDSGHSSETENDGSESSTSEDWQLT